MPDPDAKYAVEQVDLDPAAFAWRHDDDGWTWSGPCPRCGHDVDKRFREEGLFAFRERRPQKAAGRAEVETDAMRCNCLHTHEGGEAGQGCGAWWGLEVEGLG